MKRSNENGAFLLVDNVESQDTRDPRDPRARRRQFYRALSDLLEEYADVAETEGPLELDGGLWRVTGQIVRGG